MDTKQIEQFIGKWLPHYWATTGTREFRENEQFKSDLLKIMKEVAEAKSKEVAIGFAEHVLIKSGYPQDLQAYAGLPGMFKKWYSEYPKQQK